MVAGLGIAGIVGLGAVGGILANIALTPLTAGASLLQSYWYGSGLILGERMMYTVHWEKIKGRLDKGEDFLQVLDQIMNDDITAIANLSFKAMDETGKLYLDKAGTTLANFVDRLLTAIINPESSIHDDIGVPPPPGETVEGLISFTVGELELMTLQQLTSIINNSHLYTETTVAFAKTVKGQKLLDEQTQQEEKEEAAILKYNLTQTEIIFLQELFTFLERPLEDMYAQFITKFSSNHQDIIIAFLSRFSINGIFTIRTISDGSNAKLKEMRDLLAAKRAGSGDINQANINAIHISIFAWQKIYSR